MYFMSVLQQAKKIAEQPPTHANLKLLREMAQQAESQGDWQTQRAISWLIEGIIVSIGTEEG